jgi:HEAT repeat protein
MFLKRCLLLAATAVILTAAAVSALAQSDAKQIIAQQPAKLVQLLGNPNATVFEKAKACQALAVVGTKGAIPALVALLPDEKLNLYARFGLEGIPDPAVDEAFRDAATRLQGRPRIGVLDSIGQRKDARAVTLLKGFLTNSDVAVASAAAGALGRIGTPEAAKVLQEAIVKSSPGNSPLADACLACAEAVAAVGNSGEALALYESVGKADVPKHLKVAALDGQFRIHKADALDPLLKQIRSSDPAFFKLGLAVARTMPGGKVTLALAGELQALPAERQALLLSALGDRKETAGLLPVLRDASKSKSTEVREAAIQVLARMGDASAGDVLLAASLGDNQVARTAKEALKTLPGNQIDAAIVAKLAGADGKAKVTLLELVGARQIAAAAPAARQALADADEAVRIAAIAAIGQLVELKDIELLTARALGSSGQAEAAAARSALKMAAQRMSDRDGCAAKLAACLKGASAADQTYLLELLGKVSGAKALEIVVAAVKSDDPATKDAASRVLGEWVNADAAPALLQIAKNDPDVKYQIRALRGYVRIARQLQLPADAKLTMFRTAMEIAKRNDERQLALGILSRIPSAATLQLAVGHVGDAPLKDAAVDAVLKIAPKVVGTEPTLVAEAMQKVLDAGVRGNPANRAKQLLEQAKAAAK